MANCMQAVIGIGSNMGDRLKNINGAVRSLSRLPKTKITACSHVYETKPMGYEDQSMFYNAAVTVETELSAQMLLGACLGIEAAMGRVREIYHGARCMDLDVLLYEGFTQREKELNVPHPGILERAFVLFPLLELFPEKNAFGFDFADAPGFKDGDDVQRVGAAEEILN